MALTDDEITEKWRRACLLYSKNSPLAKRIGLMIADELEGIGITEADIDRLFPLSPIRVWLRHEYIDPGMA